jgi:putative membrane protein
MKRIFFALTVLGLIMAVFGFSFAQQASPALNSHDMKFMKDAAMNSQLEIKMSQMALNQSNNQQVRQFAQRILNDHTKASQDLTSIAQQKGLTVDTTLDAKQQKTIDDLASKSGADFDRAYMKEATKDHKKDIKAFEKEANKGQDADLKSFASRTLPVLKEHETMAKDLKHRV